MGEVWGVGRRIEAQFQEAGIKTILDLVKLDPTTVKRRWFVVLEPTVRDCREALASNLMNSPHPNRNLPAPAHLVIQ